MQAKRATYLVVPCACAVGIRALEARVHVDQNAAVAVQVRWALAVAATAIAGERDGLPGKRALVHVRRREEAVCRRPLLESAARLCGDGEEGECKGSGENAREHLDCKGLEYD